MVYQLKRTVKALNSVMLCKEIRDDWYMVKTLNLTELLGTYIMAYEIGKWYSIILKEAQDWTHYFLESSSLNLILNPILTNLDHVPIIEWSKKIKAQIKTGHFDSKRLAVVPIYSQFFLSYLILKPPPQTPTREKRKTNPYKCIIPSFHLQLSLICVIIIQLRLYSKHKWSD